VRICEAAAHTVGAVATFGATLPIAAAHIDNAFRTAPLDGQRVLIYDAGGGGPVEFTWQYGAHMFASRFDHVIGAHSWDDVPAQLLRIAPDGLPRVVELQFWGHGSDGAAYIGHQPFTAAQLATPAWQQIKHIFVSNPQRSLWWFRTCCTLNGDAGRAFASAVSAHFGGIKVAGHTVVIGLTHGGLVVKRPGQAAAWADNSGGSCLCTDMGHELLLD